jgi:hypothetical protein
MRTFVTLILLFLFAITLVHAQQEHLLIVKKPAQIQINNAVINGLSLRKIGDKKSIISLNPLKANDTSTLNLTALIQGFNIGSVMNSVNPIVVRVELHDATTMDGIESQIGTLSSAGVGTFSFSSSVEGTPYYIVVKYSNTIETWSATPHAFSSGTLNYDFTSAVAQTYGSNLILNGTKYCIYSGDVN